MANVSVDTLVGEMMKLYKRVDHLVTAGRELMGDQVETMALL